MVFFCLVLDKMKRKTGPVSSSTLRRRVRQDVEKRLEQIREDCTFLGNYLEARQRTNNYMSSDTSDQESEEEAIPLKRAPMTVPLHSHFVGDYDDDDDAKKKENTCKRDRGSTTIGTVLPIAAPLSCTPSDVQYESGRPAEETPSTSSRCGPTGQGGWRGSEGFACCAAQIHMLGVMENIKQQLDQVKQQQDQLLARFDHLIHNKQQTTGPEVEWSEDPVRFPLSTVEEVSLFEARLNDPSNFQLQKSVISSLATIGGYDIKRVTWNILARMFSDDVGKSINWKGVNGKKAFSQMTSKTLLLHAVRKNRSTRDATDDDILKHAIRWFNLAADRGTSRRRATTNAPLTDQK
uniref:uncharacterized protein LOC120826417 isoform X1 n=1 Tax=Gasterosteus aculeatus aculeatus TaxID=481459 RepID=UPI0000E3B124|nr:uncharacterized protein LOC120826417 isoform X1 [Gasterosteus aculeatus aculeatus]